MKKSLIALVVVVLLGAAGAGWYVFLRPHDQLALARSLMAKGDARAAQLELRSILLSDPADAEAHFRLGEVQLRLSDPIAAEKELKEARQRGWDEKAVRAPLASAVLAQGRDAEVLASFVPDGLPPDKAASVLVSRANAYLALHRRADAAAEAAEAERLDPHDVDAALASAAIAAYAGDRTQAQRGIDRALAIDPHSVAVLMLQAQERQVAGDLPGALAALDLAVAAGPDQAQPRFVRAQLRMQANRDADARSDVAVLLKQDSRSPAANFLQAQLLARAHDYRGADAALELVGPALDQMSRGEMLRAIIKSNVNQPEQAAEAAGRYLGHQPGDPAAYRLVAMLALQTHRPADAADVLNRAVLSGHADAAAYDLLGQAESQLGRADAAVAAMQQAAALAPRDAAILARLAQLQLGRGDATDAAGDLQKLLDLTPAATEVSAKVSAAASGQAAGSATAVGQAPPTTTQTATALVLALLQAGEVDRAAVALERLQRLGGSPVQLDILTGLLRTAQLDVPGAQAAFESALKQPDITSAQAAATRVNLAGALELSGQHDQAEALLRQVLTAEPANLQALAALERLLLGMGRRDEAVRVMEAAHAAAPSNAALTATLADLYDRTNRADQAIAMIDAQRKSAPDPKNAVAVQTDQVLQGARLQAQLAAGKRHDAEASLLTLLAARPRDLGLRRALAGMLLADHDAAGAQSVVDDGLAVVPGAPVLLALSVETALQTGGQKAAVERADELARDPANLPAARLLKGQVFMTLKQYPEALAAFTAELQAGDAPAAIALAASVAAQAMGQTDAAAGLLRGYLTSHPDAADVGSALAVLEINAKRLDSARTLLLQVLAKQPNDAVAMNNLAWVDQQLQRPQQAKELAQRSWLLSATPQAADTLGWVLLGGESGAPLPGQSTVALDLLRQAAASLPNDPSVQYHYAEALKANGQGPAASAILTKLVVQPAFDEQPQARKLLGSLPHS